jgi:hypothetical protein
MSGPARSRDHRREALRRAVNLIYEFLRAPPQRPSGDVCFLLTSTYMDVGKPEIGPGRLRDSGLAFPIENLSVIRPLPRNLSTIPW